MAKVVWITVLNKEANEAAARKLHQAASAYGLSPAGHFWQDDLARMAWSAAREDLLRKETALWVILGSATDGVAKVCVRPVAAGLGVQAGKGHGFPIVLIPRAVNWTRRPCPPRSGALRWCRRTGFARSQAGRQGQPAAQEGRRRVPSGRVGLQGWGSGSRSGRLRATNGPE
jgi:hypothetical protein